ncbi:MAG TPA: ATP-binding protein [Pseudonocardia sp.]|jgi:anti-sigma regulatory factor (Ser/Thr protein kinase)
MSAAAGAEPLRLRLTGSALPFQLSSVRSRVAAWAEGLGAPPGMVDDLVLATHEALANIADHAYADRADLDGQTGPAFLDAELTTVGEIVVMVRDEGRWRPPVADPGWRGRGLVIIRGLSDDVQIRHDDSGTTVQMRWRLHRAADPLNQQDHGTGQTGSR